jgi:hypothetical protein
MARTPKILTRAELDKIIQESQTSMDIGHELTSIKPEILNAMAKEILTLWNCFGGSF